MKVIIFSLLALLGLQGCINKTPKPDNPYYAYVPPQNLVPPQAYNGSIYQASTNRDLYGNGTARRVGDVITVVLTESTQSSKSASSDYQKDSSSSVSAGSFGGQPITFNGNPLSLDFPNSTTDFEGDGSASQSNSLTGNISVTVHQVLPNGLLLVRGEKWLTLNQGDEYIRVSGMVRPQDVEADNTVASTKLADARITYSGTGDVHNASVAGWLTRFFVSTFWPF